MELLLDYLAGGFGFVIPDLKKGVGGYRLFSRIYATTVVSYSNHPR
jgi:hypothetical protein